MCRTDFLADRDHHPTRSGADDPQGSRVRTCDAGYPLRCGGAYFPHSAREGAALEADASATSMVVERSSLRYRYAVLYTMEFLEGYEDHRGG